MERKTGEEPDYGNWVSAKLVYLPAGVTALFLGLSLISYFFMIGAGLSSAVFAYFAYARYAFSPKGGNIQERVQQAVLDRLEWDGEGRVLDIGCGNGPLAIRLAKKYPNVQVTGIDYWSKFWDYSTRACQRNAKLEGVADRTTFQKATASALPFRNESFDAAVSNFVFHTVQDTENKSDLIKEALRVLRRGGKFAFQDLFLNRRVYGNLETLLETIRSWEIEKLEFIDTSHSEYIPKALRVSFMVGSIGILYGTK